MLFVRGIAMKKSILSVFLGAITMATAAATTFPAPSADFVLIDGGTFQMGSPASEDWRSNDEEQHLVRGAPFYMAKYEVTQNCGAK